MMVMAVKKMMEMSMMKMLEMKGRRLRKRER